MFWAIPLFVSVVGGLQGASAKPAAKPQTPEEIVRHTVEAGFANATVGFAGNISFTPRFSKEMVKEDGPYIDVHDREFTGRWWKKGNGQHYSEIGSAWADEQHELQQLRDWAKIGDKRDAQSADYTAGERQSANRFPGARYTGQDFYALAYTVQNVPYSKFAADSGAIKAPEDTNPKIISVKGFLPGETPFRAKFDSSKGYMVVEAAVFSQDKVERVTVVSSELHGSVWYPTEVKIDLNFLDDGVEVPMKSTDWKLHDWKFGTVKDADLVIVDAPAEQPAIP